MTSVRSTLSVIIWWIAVKNIIWCIKSYYWVLFFTEQFGQQPVPVGMVAYFQNRVQQGGDVYRPCRPPWRELDGKFGFHRPFSSRYRHGHPHGSRRCACGKCLVHVSLFFNCEYSGFGSPWTTRARRQMPSVRQGFREKYRKPTARMIFSETARLDLAVRTKAFANFAR